MNRTESVSIGRRGFVCEQDAYTALKNYLVRSEKALSADPDQKEILADIELSMAGHLHELSKDLVVDLETAKKVIALMGEVEIHDTNNKEENKQNEDKTASVPLAERLKDLFKKPLYKDHEREIGDGVCAGLAKALDIDPVWVRLVFVLVTIITQGVGIVLYIVLSIIMKDEPSYQKKTAGEVIGAIRTKLSTTADSARPYERALKKLIVGIFVVVWNLLRTFVCIVLVVAAIVWASYLFFMINSTETSALFNGSPGWLEFVTVFSAGLLLLIPLFELLVAMFRPRAIRSRLSLALWSIWALSLIVTVAGSINIYPKVDRYLRTEQPKNKYVYVQMVGSSMASLCISPLGNCEKTTVVLQYGERCGRPATLYDKNDRVIWMSRLWEPHYKSLEYPVTKELYCSEMKKIQDATGLSGVMFAKEDINDPVYLNEQVNPATGEMKKYWGYEYMSQ